MNIGSKVMATKLSGINNQSIAIGEEFRGMLTSNLTKDGVLRILHNGKDFISSNILAVEKTGNVFLVKTRNSIYLVQPMQ
jgi:hypothetical protein